MTTYVLSIIAEGQDRASGPLSGVTGALGSIARIAGGILTAGALIQIGRQIFDMGNSAINATAQMQAFELGLNTLMARELRSADATLTLNEALDAAAPLAASVAAELRKISIISPYELGTVQDTFRLGMAFGFTSDEALKLTNGMLNMAAGVGANNEQLNRMSYNFAQIRLQGKVTAMDIRQLAMAGFDLTGALQAIGDQFGVTIEDHNDFNEAIASGKITWEQFVEGFEKYADDNFGGASERMSRTLQGLKSTFSDLFLLTMPKLLGPAADVVTGFLNGILDNFIAFSDSGALEAWGEQLANGVSNFLENVSRMMEMGSELKNNFQAVFSAIRDEIVSFGEQAAPLAERLIETLSGLGTAIAPHIEKIGAAIGDTFVVIKDNVIPFLLEALEHVVVWFEENGPLIASFVDVIATAFQDLPIIVQNAWNVISPILMGILDLVLGLGTLFMQVVTGDWAGAWETLKQIVVNAGIAIYDAINAFLDWIELGMGMSFAEMGEMWRNNWNMFIEIVHKLGPFLSTAANNAMTAMKNAISTKLAELKTSIAEKFTEIQTKITSTWTSIKSNVTGLMSSMLSDAINKAGQFVQVGAGIISGIVSGIQRNVQKVLNVLAGLVEQAVASVMGALGIKSPSKVFEGIGTNVIEGLAKGIQGNDNASGAMSDQAQALSNPFSGSNSTNNSSTQNNVFNIYGSDPHAVAQEIMVILKQQGVAA